MDDSQDDKIQALRKAGTLNPSPDAVVDPLFASHEFFDARDLVQVKYEMLRRARQEGRTVTDAARQFGFSRTAFYQAWQTLEREGLPGLIPARPGPRAAHKLTDAVLDFVDEQRRLEPTLRISDLLRLVRKRFKLSVHPRSLERALERRRKKE
jgi:transposase-like protein